MSPVADPVLEQILQAIDLARDGKLLTRREIQQLPVSGLDGCVLHVKESGAQFSVSVKGDKIVMTRDGITLTNDVGRFPNVYSFLQTCYGELYREDQ